MYKSLPVTLWYAKFFGYVVVVSFDISDASGVVTSTCCLSSTLKWLLFTNVTPFWNLSKEGQVSSTSYWIFFSYSLKSLVVLCCVLVFVVGGAIVVIIGISVADFFLSTFFSILLISSASCILCVGFFSWFCFDLSFPHISLDTVRSSSIFSKIER